jgi:LmbE family N-acetylglucosaminyl deacetylase
MDALIRAQKPCMVVAHPDDESLWGGGLLARYREKDWLIVCCTTPYADPERLMKFKKACEVFGAKPHLLRHPERGGLMPLDRLYLGDRDLIVTHGPKGEYGHPQHKEAYAALVPRFDLIWFAYGDKPQVTLELTADEYALKLEAIKCYDHVSPTDKRPKWEALLDYYGKKYDLSREPYGLSDKGADGAQAPSDSAA